MLPLDRALDELFRAPSHAPVLRALFALPAGIGVSAREISRRAGVSHPAAGRALDAFVDDGIVDVQRTLAVNLYQLNRIHEAVAHLGRLFDWEGKRDDGFAAALSEDLAALPQVLEAIRFGSNADPRAGLADVDSDVDIAITCRPGTEEMTYAQMSDLRDTFHRHYGVRLEFLVSETGKESAPIWHTIRTTGMKLDLARGAHHEPTQVGRRGKESRASVSGQGKGVR